MNFFSNPSFLICHHVDLQLLRKILHKKMNDPQNYSWPSSMKRYIEDKEMLKRENDDERQEKSNGGCKWVKTDSECKDIPLLVNLHKFRPKSFKTHKKNMRTKNVALMRYMFIGCRYCSRDITPPSFYLSYHFD